MCSNGLKLQYRLSFLRGICSAFEWMNRNPPKGPIWIESSPNYTWMAFHVVFKYSFHQQQVARQSTGGSGMLESITALIHHPKTFLIVHPSIHCPTLAATKEFTHSTFWQSLSMYSGSNDWINESVRSPNWAHAIVSCRFRVVLVATTTTRCSISNQRIGSGTSLDSINQSINQSNRSRYHYFPASLWDL